MLKLNHGRSLLLFSCPGFIGGLIRYKYILASSQNNVKNTIDKKEKTDFS